MKKYWVYILQSLSNGSFYTGSTKNLDKRVNEHNRGRNKFTKANRPWKIIHQESMNRYSDAVKRERFLKSGVGRQRLKGILTKP